MNMPSEKNSVTPAFQVTTYQSKLSRQVHRLPAASKCNLPGVPEVGDVVGGQFEVLGRLGGGGMGVVLEALDLKLDRRVAIKVVHPELTLRDDILEMFLREARVMAGIRHPNVVEIYQFGMHAELCYFVMEHVPGQDLDVWAEEKGGVLAIDEVLGLLEQVCRGVQEIHDAGAVHRDLKPGNILIGPSFRAKVADFGLATRGKVTSEFIAGTPEFMAPEVILEEDEPEFAARIDVYALGVIAYELLTGHSPFAGASVDAVLESQVQDTPALATELRPELPEAFDALFADALAKDPAKRIGSAAELRTRLLEARNSKRSASRPVTIALVEDDEDFAVWISAMLAEHMPNVRIEHFTNGADGLAAIQEGRFSLAVLDLEIPGLNGMELCASIRGTPIIGQLPILMCTGVGGPLEWKVLRELGADGFVIKPMDELSIVTEIRRLLSRPQPAIREVWPPARRA